MTKNSAVGRAIRAIGSVTGKAVAGPGHIQYNSKNLNVFTFGHNKVAYGYADMPVGIMGVFIGHAIGDDPDEEIADRYNGGARPGDVLLHFQTQEEAMFVRDAIHNRKSPENLFTEEIEKKVRDKRQTAVLAWAHAAFGGIEGFDPCTVQERCRRFFEEAVELCQALGMEREEADRVTEDVYTTKSPGEPHQEVGGVMVTLNALAEVAGVSIAKAEHDEWARVQSKTKAHWESRHVEKMKRGL